MSITYPARTRYNQTHKHAVLNRRTRINIPYTLKEEKEATHSMYAIRQIILDLCTDQNRKPADYLNSAAWHETPVVYPMKAVNEIVADVMHDCFRLPNPAQS